MEGMNRRATLVGAEDPAEVRTLLEDCGSWGFDVFDLFMASKVRVRCTSRAASAAPVALPSHAA